MHMTRSIALLLCLSVSLFTGCEEAPEVEGPDDDALVQTVCTSPGLDVTPDPDWELALEPSGAWYIGPEGTVIVIVHVVGTCDGSTPDDAFGTEYLVEPLGARFWTDDTVTHSGGSIVVSDAYGDIATMTAAVSLTAVAQ